jgi:hypothetical protein
VKNILNFSNPAKTLSELVNSDLIGTNIFEYDLSTKDSNDEQATEV